MSNRVGIIAALSDKQKNMPLCSGRIRPRFDVAGHVEDVLPKFVDLASAVRNTFHSASTLMHICVSSSLSSRAVKEDNILSNNVESERNQITLLVKVPPRS